MNQTLHDKLLHKDYLGDGVYVGFDGYQIVVWVEDESCLGPGAIALEDQTLEAFDRYRARLKTLLGG